MALVALALAAAVASELLRLRLVAAGNDPSGATWAVGMLASTVILASTALGWLALAARALRRRPIADRLSATSALIGVGLFLALLASVFGIERLSATGLLSSFRGRWILSLVALAVVVVLIRSLRHEARSRRTAALAGVSAAAGALGGAGLWLTVGAAGYQSFPSVETYWALVVLTASAALATAVTVSLLAALRRFPLTRLLEVVQGRPVHRLPTGVGALAGVSVLAAALRFSLLDHQSFSADEAYTVWLVLDDRNDLAPPASPLPGFTLVERLSVQSQVIYRFRSPRPALVRPESFSPRRLRRGMSDARLQRGAAPVADEASHPESGAV